VPGLQFTSSIGGTTARVAEFRRGYVSLYLNENLINESEATSIDMNNVAYVKVFSPPGISGPNGSGGAIVIYTKRGGDIGKSSGSIPSGMEYKTNIGYTAHKEFYSPIYDEKDKSIKIEDARTTLLWNPWIDIDKNHQKVKIVFYNNDISNAFRLTIEGMDNRGKLLHFSKIIQ
jgi:hypothetical protein